MASPVISIRQNGKCRHVSICEYVKNKVKKDSLFNREITNKEQDEADYQHELHDELQEKRLVNLFRKLLGYIKTVQSCSLFDVCKFLPC